MKTVIKLTLKNLSYSVESLSIYVDKSRVDAVMSVVNAESASDDATAPFDLDSIFSEADAEGEDPPESAHPENAEQKGAEEVEYITINEYEQNDVPDAYGGVQPVVFRKPTQEELAASEQVFSGFIVSWCRGWGTQPVDRVKIINHRMKESNQRFALYLKWWFHSKGSMQQAVMDELLKLATTPMWGHCFGDEPLTDRLVMDVANNMCQIFSSSLPDLNVFYSHKWGLPNTLFEPGDQMMPGIFGAEEGK
jgi:hypothetical protein